MKHTRIYLPTKEVEIEEEEKLALDLKFRKHAKTLRFQKALFSHFDVVREICFMPGNHLASASEDCTVKLWNLNDID